MDSQTKRIDGQRDKERQKGDRKTERVHYITLTFTTSTKSDQDNENLRRARNY